MMSEDKITEEKRIGTISILMNPVNPETVAEVNHLLSNSSEMICGRMGMPFHERHTGVIALIIQGDNDQISALCGRLGKVPCVTVRSLLLSR